MFRHTITFSSVDFSQMYNLPAHVGVYGHFEQPVFTYTGLMCAVELLCGEALEVSAILLSIHSDTL